MARLHHLLARALASHHLLRPSPLPFSARPTLPLHSPPPPPHPHPHTRSPPPFPAAASRYYGSSASRRRRRGSAPPMLPRRRRARRKGPSELSVQIGIEEALPDDPLILSIAEALRTDVGRAMKLALHNLENSEYRTRDTGIRNVDNYDSVEVSLLLCDDGFIRKLNKEWRDEDHATDVLSMSQHIPGLDIPILQLGDLVISVETARRQAEERGHTLLDEMRILTVHGLLHLLGFDHELGKEAEEEMEKEEEQILNNLEWKGKGLIRSAYHFSTDMDHSENSDEANSDVEKMSVREGHHQPKLTHIVCDIDGTLVDYEGHLHAESIEPLREAISRGVTVIMVTGRTRASTIATFKLLNIEEKDEFISENSPGVFLQGSLVYGGNGQLIYRANLDVDICKEACLYSLKNKTPLVLYCEEQCLTLFEHPSVDLLHTLHHETKVKVMPSVEDLLEYSSIQKLLFLTNAEEDLSVLIQHWSELTEGKACVVKAQPNALEIVPLNASKGGGIRVLLDHLGITEDSDLEAVGD
ncbi:endoribonuclease YBEY, chloroplastic-like [Lolium rigidum]|uniref:endoribonuclease YBEY, chloroplastic-like n=1 Tax=Lolium rigidum TaxID=89674 RepID=UPI001F5DF853|nr:endoribonuclease YBEY, chloroplastic-like [Lolium rigidum]